MKLRAFFRFFLRAHYRVWRFLKITTIHFCALRSKDKCFTAFQAVVEATTPDPKKYQSKTITKLDGAALEQIVNLAFMISTHSKGLKGMTFVEWFPFFIQQLGCYPSYKFEEEPKKIDLWLELSI